MESSRYDNIEYDDQWQSVQSVKAESIAYDYDYDDYNDDREEDEKNSVVREKVEKLKIRSAQPVIKLQLILCIIIALLAFAFKAFGGDLFSYAYDWYKTNLNNPVVINLPLQQ